MPLRKPALLKAAAAVAAAAALLAGCSAASAPAADAGAGEIRVVPTIHPSAILRIPDAAAKKAARTNLVADLRTAASELSDGGR